MPTDSRPPGGVSMRLKRGPWMRTKRAAARQAAGAGLVGTLILVGGAACAQIGSSDPVTDQGRVISDLFNLELVLALLLFLLVGGLLTTIIVRFRGRPGDADPAQVTGNRKLEVTWTVLPVLVLACLFVLTVRTMNAVDAASPDELPIQVIGHQWWWEFQYRGQGIVVANELHVPVDAPLRLDLQSADVIHSFWLPQFGWMEDNIPGKTNQMRVRVNQVGDYVGACTQFCGVEHARMRLRVTVQPRDQFDAWVQQQRQPAAAPTSAAAEHGQQVFQQRTCSSCHVIQGTSAQGHGRPRPHPSGQPRDHRRWHTGQHARQPAAVGQERSGSQGGCAHAELHQPFGQRPQRSGELPGGTQVIVASLAHPYPYSDSVATRSERLLDWVTTADHKDIGILYLLTTGVFFVLGGIEALMIRVQLAVPGNTFLDPGAYNAVFTMHGTTMIFLVVMPLLLGFANYFVPLQIGARRHGVPPPERLELLAAAVRGPDAVLRLRGGHAARYWLVQLRAADREAVHLAAERRLLGARPARHQRGHHRHGHQPAGHHRQTARAGHDAWAHARLHLDVAGHRVADSRGHSRPHRRAGHAAAGPLPGYPFLRRRAQAATRSCGSTCSGTSATPRSTSWRCRPSGSSRRSSRSSPASRSSATPWWSAPAWPSRSSRSLSGPTTCSPSVWATSPTQFLASRA